jgi:hypothetical protein
MEYWPTTRASGGCVRPQDVLDLLYYKNDEESESETVSFMTSVDPTIPQKDAGSGWPFLGGVMDVLASFGALSSFY